jgi:hypothetical protein
VTRAPHDRSGSGQPLSQLAEPRLDELLPLQRGFVFAVLAQVAELDRFADLGRQRDVELVLETIQLDLELLLQLFDHESVHRVKWNARLRGPGAD